jgi:hypothetical protein
MPKVKVIGSMPTTAVPVSTPTHPRNILPKRLPSPEKTIRFKDAISKVTLPKTTLNFHQSLILEWLIKWN